MFLRPDTAVEVCFAVVTYQGRWTAGYSIDLTRCYEARAGTSEVCWDVSASLLCCFGLLVFKVFVWCMCQWNSLLRTCSLCVFWPALLFFLCFLSLFPLSPTPLSASLSLSSSFHLRAALCTPQMVLAIFPLNHFHSNSPVVCLHFFNPPFQNFWHQTPVLLLGGCEFEVSFFFLSIFSVCVFLTFLLSLSHFSATLISCSCIIMAVSVFRD